jgi:NAD(P)-dependent dehydrogenase (short-subunit alcohol dehydrogenase family)
MISLENHQVVVIGGSSGIGLAVAEAVIAAKGRVTVVGRDAERLDAVRQRLPQSSTAVADVLDLGALTSMFAGLEHVDHLVVTAGRAVLSSFTEGPEPAEQLRDLDVKLVGAANAVRAALPRFRPGGSVVLTGGVSTTRPVAGAWTTSVATAAVEQLARTLALELAPLRVNAVSPGWTATPMWDAVLGDAAASTLESVAASHLTGRVAAPEEVAAAVLALLVNPAISAEVLHVDGGARLV